MGLPERLIQYRSLPLLGKLTSVLLRMLGISFPKTVVVGPGLTLPHGAVGLVVHDWSVLGSNVRLYQGVTLGRSDTYLPSRLVQTGGGIVVEDGVVVGAGAALLFRSGQTLRIGENAVIGANSVVTQDVPAAEIWAGSPARKVGIRELA